MSGMGYGVTRRPGRPPQVADRKRAPASHAGTFNGSLLPFLGIAARPSTTARLSTPRALLFGSGKVGLRRKGDYRLAMAEDVDHCTLLSALYRSVVFRVPLTESGSASSMTSGFDACTSVLQIKAFAR